MRLRSLTLALVFAVVVGGAFALTFALAMPERSGPAPAERPAREVPAWKPAPASTPAPEADGGSARQVFSHTCGMCHTLGDAKARGLFGPDLDEARPSAAKVRRMIRTGSLDGVMQPNLLRGERARRVAEYVARVAGRD
jgi:mono/diheme cytochrome c family protein